MKITKDKIFLDKKKTLISSLSFLKALNISLPDEQAIQIADVASANYMITYYEDILKGTEPNSQERFDRFRAHYFNYASKSTYCKILETNDNVLRVQFNRCPFAEILFDEKLSHFAESSCKSDLAFTKRLLPGVEFKRLSSIVAGEEVCVMEWSKKMQI